MEITNVLWTFVLILVIYMWYRRHDPRLPPCPVTPLPIVGHMFHLGKNPRQQLSLWRKKTGDLFTLYMGQTKVVVVNGYTLVKEVFVKNGDITNDRPFIFFDTTTGIPGRGIAFTSGPIWKESKEVTVSILRSLGMGKNILAEKIQEIAAELIDVLTSLEGKPTVLTPLTSISVGNVICSMAIGRRFRHDDERFLKVIQNMRSNIADGGPANLINYFPFLQYVPGDFFAAKLMRTRAQYIMSDFAEKFIKEIEHNNSPEDEPDNLIAAYIQERNKKLRAGKSTLLDNDNLSRIIFDVFGGGMETITTTLDWAVLYMLYHPDIQEKMFKEIETEVGTDRLPNMQDKAKLPYLNAFIHETQRISSVIPLGAPRTNNKEITIAGYTLPKGTQLYLSLDSVLFDKEIWGEDAESFRPERFLDEKGKLKNLNEFIPFSIGKRFCVGESLARMELFIFLGAMTQRFKFLPENPAVLPTLEVVFGFTACPVPYKVRVLERKTAGH